MHESARVTPRCICVIAASFQTGAKEEREMKGLLLRLYREEAGQDLTEYALLLILVALVAITTMKTLGSSINTVFANAASNLTAGT
jgi:pilus assembly protein Flp/PilA